MKSNRSLLLSALLLILAAFLLSLPAAAQEPSEGVNSGNYNVKQSFEIGYRWTGITGSRSVYNTFINLNPGPRLLEHTLEMRSLNHQGWLFDDFSIHSFGYGGDPNDVTRLRMYKNKWYNFTGTFRRDRNFWDYNLLANPLNPNVVVANAPAGFSPVINDSPHEFQVSRRMSDFNLTILPQSGIRLRLGYSYNVSEGPSFSSFHEGTDVLLFQNWKTTLHSYQVGVDVKSLPKTNLSYDKFFYFYKGDTSWQDQNLTFQLPNLTPVDLGLPFNTPASQPCATPFSGPPPGTVNPTCNGYLTYTRTGRVRISYPTDQFSLQTSYFKNLDLSARFVYSTAGGNRRGDVLDYSEFFQGLVTRTRARQFAITGPARMKRFSTSFDFGATLRVTDKLHIVDMFRFQNFRVPGRWDSFETSLFGTSMLIAPNVFTPGAAPPASCPTPTSAGCPQHATGSPADRLAEVFHAFLGQQLENNLIEAQYEFNKRMGARLGYRFRHREIVHSLADEQSLLFFSTLAARGACAFLPAPAPPNTLPPGCVAKPDGSIVGTVVDEPEIDDTTINEHSGLFGFWTRPTDQLRFSFDLELMSADNAFTRISPRQLQHYKLRASYKPASWASLAGSFNIIENRDNVFQVNNKQHNRSYGVAVVLEPNSNFGLDFGYDFNDTFSQTNICFTLTGAALPPGSSACPVIVPAATIQALSLYQQDSHDGYFDVRWQPVKRLGAHVGYHLVSTSGSTLILNPNAPPGPLAFNYHKPTAGFAFDLNKNLTFKADWNYYGYNEKSPPGPGFLPRDFRGNTMTAAFRYVF